MRIIILVAGYKLMDEFSLRAYIVANSELAMIVRLQFGSLCFFDVPMAGEAWGKCICYDYGRVSLSFKSPSK